ncbi:MAG: hypothetical protein J0653_03320, partial [Deltaproteobacteria bacterium]|nr:hypothetical protein [Deltaproteobacteria bacterium]
TTATGYDTSIGAAVDAGTTNITINSAGTFTNTAAGTLTTGGAINITSGNNTNTSSYATTINGAVSAGVGGNNNIAINSSGAFSNNSAGTLTATGSISIKTYWDGTNKRNLTLAGDVTAGVSGIKLTSSGTINQTAGVITTTGTLYGADQSGGTPTNAYPSARGAVTLSQSNQIANLGPFYLLGGGSDGFTVNDVSGGLTLAGTIENSHGNITITTAGGALNLGTYSVYAGGRASGGANVALTGQGIVQGIGSSINTSGGTTDSPRTGTNGGGTITLTGHDGSASGTISLAGTLETQNATSSAIKIRGTSDLALPNIVVPNGTLVLGDDTATIGL